MMTQSQLKEILTYNCKTGDFFWKKRKELNGGDISKIRSWNSCHADKKAGSINAHGYMVIHHMAKLYTGHRLAWLYMYGVMPDSGIDHIDGNKANNKILNLRLANQSENNQNKRRAQSNNKHNLLGVSFCKFTGKYRATIYINGKQKTIGRFNSAEDAHEAYLIQKRISHSYCTI